MRQLVCAVALAIALAVPAAAKAQSNTAPPPSTSEIFGLSKEQALVVGAGVVVGALALHLLVGAEFTYFAGAVAGGLAADWWYEHGGKEKLPELTRRLAAPGPAGIRLVPAAAILR